MRVYVDGVKPGRIQFIGEAKFGPGEWAGVFLDEPIGKESNIHFIGAQLDFLPTMSLRKSVIVNILTFF